MKAFYTILLLIVSNIFHDVCLVWAFEDARDKSHLQLVRCMPWLLFSWVIALAEYSCQVPANRIGFIGNGGPFSLMQLKVIQEVITLDYLYGVYNGSFQRGSAALESFCRFCMSGTGGIFCIL